MNRILSAILVFLSIATLSCDKEYPREEQRLVIEGWIENGEFPVVLVSLSGTIDNDGDPISDFMVRWATVSINDGDSTYILTGGLDKKYFPPYAYKGYDLRGEIGKTYTLTVEYDGMRATATTSIPQPIEIDSLEVKPIEGSDTLRAINVHFTAPTAATEYYRLRYREYNSEGRFYPSFLGTFNTDSATGATSVPLYRAKRKTVEDYTPYFPIGSQVEVRLGHISKESYDIWTDYDNIVNFGSSIFFQQQTTLRSNINGGYGFWIGYGISKSSIEITN